MQLPSPLALTLFLAACGAQSTPAETTASLPGDDQGRHSPRFVPERQGDAAAPISAPSNDTDLAPGGTAVDSAGKTIDMAAAYANSSVVLVFYRGHW